MNPLKGPIKRAIAAAATLTGKRFGLLVASSLVATSAIVASAATTPGGNGPLAALLARSLADTSTPVAAAPAPAPAIVAAGPAGGSATSLPAPAPASQPIETIGSAAAPQASPQVAPEEASAIPATPTASTPEAGRIKHVFVINLASSGYEAAFGATSQMPYLSSTLRPQGLLLSNYSLLSSAATPNAIAAVSGQKPNPSTQNNCPTYSNFPAGTSVSKSGVVSGSGCVYPVEVLTLPDRLATGQFTWNAYMEGMANPETGKPENCIHPESELPDAPALGGYAARQNPFVYFHSLLDLGDCTSNDEPLTSLESALKSATKTANYSYIAPDLCNAGVSAQCPAGAPNGAASADAFLAQWVPKILASPAYKEDGLLIVTFDELNPPEPGSTVAPAAANPVVGTLLLSRFLAPNSTDKTAYNPYSLERVSSELFGLEPLAAAEAKSVKTFAPALLGTDGGD